MMPRQLVHERGTIRRLSAGLLAASQVQKTFHILSVCSLADSPDSTNESCAMSALLSSCPLCHGRPFSTRRSHSGYSRRPVRCRAETEANQHTSDRAEHPVTRRQALLAAASVAVLVSSVPAPTTAAVSQASAPSSGPFTSTPYGCQSANACSNWQRFEKHSHAGYRVHQDKFDGYRFRYPQSWTPVTVCLLSSTDCQWHRVQAYTPLDPDPLIADLR